MRWRGLQVLKIVRGKSLHSEAENREKTEINGRAKWCERCERTIKRKKKKEMDESHTTAEMI